MELIIDGEPWFIDPERIERELDHDVKLVTISKHGEMVLDQFNEDGKFLQRELWMARPHGLPMPCFRVAGMAFEFVRQVKME